jgi:PDZ domain
VRTLITIGVVAVISLLSGCASIVSGTNQPITVDSPGCDGASCQLTNDKGTWYVKTPGSVIVSRAYGNLSVVCSKEGFGSANTSVASNTKAMAFGNILVGGVIGAGVDVATGAAYDYPVTISVPLTCGPGPKMAALDVATAPTAKAKSRFGVRVEDVSSALASSLGLADAGGAVITLVQQGSPAETAGLKVGDVIREFNGSKLLDTADLAGKLAEVKDGTSVIVRIVSNGQPATLQVRLGQPGDL